MDVFFRVVSCLFVIYMYDVGKVFVFLSGSWEQTPICKKHKKKRGHEGAHPNFASFLYVKNNRQRAAPFPSFSPLFPLSPPPSQSDVVSVCVLLIVSLSSRCGECMCSAIRACMRACVCV